MHSLVNCRRLPRVIGSMIDIKKNNNYGVAELRNEIFKLKLISMAVVCCIVAVALYTALSESDTRNFSKILDVFDRRIRLNEDIIQNFTKNEMMPLKEPVEEVKRLKYWSIIVQFWNKMGSLRSMDRVFKNLGYDFVNGTNGDDWDILWSMPYPFIPNNGLTRDHVWPIFNGLKPHQKINHFPDTLRITRKDYMTTHNRHLPYILPAFQLPKMLDEFNNYTRHNPDKKFVRKSIYNRGVEIVNVQDIDQKFKNKFYQVFLDNPFLIDGHHFDMGVYVIITSIDPLRIYRYDHEVLMRFCPDEYHPFNASNVRQYVIQEYYKLAVDMPSFMKGYKEYGYSLQKLFEEHVESKGFNIKNVWRKVDDAIVKIILNNEEYSIKAIQNLGFTSSKHFFELVRFDFVFTDNMEPIVMEVNLSPNLTPSNPKKQEYTMIYEQVVYNAVRIIGGQSYHEFMSRTDGNQMMTTYKNVATGFDLCMKNNCFNNCSLEICNICVPCVSAAPNDFYFHFRESYREMMSRGNFKRVFPTKVHFKDTELFNSLTYNNKINMRYFEEHCKEDDRWC